MSDFTNEALYKAVIAAWIFPTVGLDVEIIRTNDNAPKGRDPYVALNIGHFDQIGWDERGEPDPTTGDVVVLGMRESVLTVESFGTEALQLLANLRNALSLLSVQAPLRAAGVALGSWTPVLNLTQLYDTQWKERGQFSVRMRFRSETIDKAVGQIADVEAALTVKSPGTADTVIDVNIGTPYTPP